MASASLREARVEAERMLLATRSALGGRRRPARRARSARRSTRCWRELRARPRGAATATRSRPPSKALAEGTEAFAAERMNRGIRQALAGRRVEEI